jgi:hypothetical protein
MKRSASHADSESCLQVRPSYHNYMVKVTQGAKPIFLAILTPFFSDLHFFPSFFFVFHLLPQSIIQDFQMQVARVASPIYDEPVLAQLPTTPCVIVPQKKRKKKEREREKESQFRLVCVFFVCFVFCFFALSGSSFRMATTTCLGWSDSGTRSFYLHQTSWAQVTAGKEEKKPSLFIG